VEGGLIWRGIADLEGGADEEWSRWENDQKRNEKIHKYKDGQCGVIQSHCIHSHWSWWSGITLHYSTPHLQLP
jgi:hypothetical protein